MSGPTIPRLVISDCMQGTLINTMYFRTEHQHCFRLQGKITLMALNF